MNFGVMPVRLGKRPNVSTRHIANDVRTTHCPASKRPKRRLAAAFLVSALVSVFALSMTSSAGAATADTGTVVVVHGLQGFAADVYLDGSSTPALSSFEFRRVTDPLALPAGSHRADLRKTGDPATAAPALSGTFDVVAGQRITVAAMLDPQGNPTWIAFPNDAWTSDSSNAEIRFRHFAATGPVTLTLDGKPVAQGATNLSQGAPPNPIAVAPGPHQLAVVDPTSGAVLVPAQNVVAVAGSIMNVYLTGRSDTSTLQLLLQSAETEAVAALAVGKVVLPDTINTGDSGLLAATGDHSTGTDMTTVARIVGASVGVLLLVGVALVGARPAPALVMVRRVESASGSTPPR
jgi:hypothetical protein